MAASVLALIPAYSHVDHRLQQVLSMAGVPWHPFHECSDLPKARSQLLSLGVMQRGVETLLLIDSDMTPSVEDVHRLLGSAALGPGSAVSGVYATRSGRPAFLPFELDSTVMVGSPGFTELRAAGLGFCAVRRESLERLASTLPRVAGSDTEWWPFCVPMLEPVGDGAVAYIPEDYSLWRRLRQVGVSLWLDQELLVPHLIREPRLPRPGPTTRG